MLDFLLGNDALSAIVAFILVLIPAVLIHELGHFLAAKAVGITILEFGIGMPPRMVKLFTWRGTDYTLNWLPLGGFVRPLGEDIVSQKGDDAVAVDRLDAEQRGFTRTMSVNEAKPLPRILFFSAGAIANFIMAFILFIVIAMMGVPQVTGGLVGVLGVEQESALATAGLQSGDVIETINGETFVDSVDLMSRLYSLDGEMVTLGVRREGVEEPVELTFTPDIGEAQPEAIFHPLIVTVAEGAPADQAGLEGGDLVVAFNGEPINSIEALQETTNAHLDEEVTLTVLRGDEELDVTLMPRSTPPAGEGAMGIGINTAARNPDLGVAYHDGAQTVLVPLSFGDAVSYSLNRIGTVISTIASIPAELIRGTADPDSLRLTSPLGISQAGAVFLQESIEQNQPAIILEFMALISLALGLTNLLPIPALDGGRILFVLIELVRGRPISPEREGVVHFVGLALLLSLMVVVLLNDIANPLTDLLR